MRKLHSILLVSLLIAATQFWGGCGRGSFVGDRLNDFSAYYNTYYNAERALEEGIRAFEEGVDQQPIDQHVFLSMFGRNDQASTQRKPFEDAVDKSSDILRKFPDSKWVDDAILIIGKAWFFTLDFVGAEQKFQEIFTLESPLHDEARFWLARTLIASGSYDEAFNHLQATLSSEDVSRHWEPYYRLALAELHVQRENWELASQELETGIEEIRDNDLASRAQFLLGQVYEKLERFEEAAASYQAVQSYRPFYELSYAAQFSRIRMLVDHVDPEAALAELRRMERDDKNYDHRAELAYLRGRVLIALGYHSDALDLYDELLYDPTANGAKVRGPIHYALGTFYRDVYSDYHFAAAHFDTASRSIKVPGTSNRGDFSVPLQAAPGAITDSEEQARVFGSFSEVMNRVDHLDSLMYLGSLDDSSFQAVVLDLRRRRAEEMDRSEQELRQRQAESGFGGGHTVVDGDREGNGANGSGGDAGFLSHRAPFRMEQARQDFILVWGDRPLVPNWRRSAAIEALAEEEGIVDQPRETSGPGYTGENLPPVNISEVPRTDKSRKAMQARRAVARYELANVLFLSMNMPDSAVTWYRLVIDEDGDQPVAQRALYALAELHRTVGDTLAARGIYETIVKEYPNSEFIYQAYERLGLNAPEGLVTDSLGSAELAYKALQEHWTAGAYDTLITGLVNLAITWPSTEVAPRALLGASKAYMEWATQDSLDVLGELPVTVQDSVLKANGFFDSQELPPAPRDTLEVVLDKPALTIEVLLEHVTTKYAASIQSRQATNILAAVGEIKNARQMVLDSLAQVRADSLAYADSLAQALLAAEDSLVVTAADSLVMPDSSVLSDLPVPNDSLGVEDTLAVDVSLPENESAPDISSSSGQAITGPDDPSLGNIDWSQGGYTIFISSSARHDMAVAFINNFQYSIADIQHELDIFGAEVEDGIEFRVGLGLFATLQEAETVMARLGIRTPKDARIVYVRPQGEDEVEE